MASQKSLILRNAAARQRLAATLDKARANGAAIPEPSFTHRDADVAKTQELEYFADVVEQLVGKAPENATAPESTPATSTSATTVPVVVQEPPDSQTAPKTAHKRK